MPVFLFTDPRTSLSLLHLLLTVNNKRSQATTLWWTGSESLDCVILNWSSFYNINFQGRINIISAPGLLGNGRSHELLMCAGQLFICNRMSVVGMLPSPVSP